MINHTNLPFPVAGNAATGARQQPTTFRRTLFATAIVLCSTSSQADVVSATIYPSHAEVTWEESHSIKAGTGIIEIGELPVSLQARDLQVRIQGIPGASIAQVQVVRVERESFVADETRHLQREIQNVSHLIQADEDDIRAWRQQITLMTQSASQPGERSASELADMAEMLQQTCAQWLSQKAYRTGRCPANQDLVILRPSCKTSIMAGKITDCNNEAVRFLQYRSARSDHR